MRVGPQSPSHLARQIDRDVTRLLKGEGRRIPSATKTALYNVSWHTRASFHRPRVTAKRWRSGNFVRGFQDSRRKLWRAQNRQAAEVSAGFGTSARLGPSFEISSSTVGRPATNGFSAKMWTHPTQRFHHLDPGEKVTSVIQTGGVSRKQLMRIGLRNVTTCPACPQGDKLSRALGDIRVWCLVSFQ